MSISIIYASREYRTREPGTGVLSTSVPAKCAGTVRVDSTLPGTTGSTTDKIGDVLAEYSSTCTARKFSIDMFDVVLR